MNIHKPILLPAALWLGGFGITLICSVPVFRYALERWPSDNYVVRVFHRGPLSDEGSKLLKAVSPDPLVSSRVANIEFETVDLEGNVEAESLEAWMQTKASTGKTPWMVVTYPTSSGNPAPVWSGPLSKENADIVIDSPKRRELARRLLEGDSAVWLLLESGDEDKDEAAFETLAARVAVLEKKLKLPEIKQEDISAGLLKIEKSRLKLKFSVLRVSRKEAAESAFIGMLLASEEDLEDLNEAMVFPVYGRGRFLSAMVGKGITDDNITRDAMFLIGPCSCEVKRLNPGTDLLVAVDWESLIQQHIHLDRELPALTGVGILDPDGPEEAAGTEQGSDSRTIPPQIGNPLATQSTPPALASTSGRFWLVLGMLALGILSVGAWIFTRRA